MARLYDHSTDSFITERAKQIDAIVAKTMCVMAYSQRREEERCQIVPDSARAFGRDVLHGANDQKRWAFRHIESGRDSRQT